MDSSSQVIFGDYILNILKYFYVVCVVKVLGGMRGMTGLLWETSLLDADEVWI